MRMNQDERRFDFHSLGAALKRAREEKGWTQEKLAIESGISYNTLIKIERGGIDNPKIETVIKLADALSVSVDKLLGK